MAPSSIGTRRPDPWPRGRDSLGISRESQTPLMDEPMSAIALIAWAFSSAVLLGYATWIARRLRVGRAHVDVPMALLLWIQLASLLVLVAGLVGGLAPIWLFGVC